MTLTTLAIRPGNPNSARSLRRVFMFRSILMSAGFSVDYDEALDMFTAPDVPQDFANGVKAWLESQTFEHGFFEGREHACVALDSDAPKNEVVEVSSQWCVMRLTRGKWCLLDTASLHKVTQHTWRADRDRCGIWYGASTVTMPDGHRRNVHMQELLLTEVPEGMRRDHVNGNGLDNRLENLRVTTIRGNAQNRFHRLAKTGRVGVKQEGSRYVARAYIDGRDVRIGPFDSAEEAEAAYKAATG